MLSQQAVSEETINKKTSAFGLKDKIGYMLGDLGNCFILGLVNSFLMIYYTNVLGVSGAIGRYAFSSFKNFRCICGCLCWTAM